MFGRTNQEYQKKSGAPLPQHRKCWDERSIAADSSRRRKANLLKVFNRSPAMKTSPCFYTAAAGISHLYHHLYRYTNYPSCAVKLKTKQQSCLLPEDPAIPVNAHDGFVPEQIHPHAAHGAQGVEESPGILHIPQLAAGGSVGVPVSDAVPGICRIRLRGAQKKNMKKHAVLLYSFSTVNNWWPRRSGKHDISEHGQQGVTQK